MMRREYNIKVYEGSNAVTIEILGDLTASAEKDMDAAYQKACGYNLNKIVLKFGDKSRINSAGILIVSKLVIKSRERKCDVFLTGVSKHYRKIFELVGLTKYTTIVESEGERRNEDI
jgi:anti-anti-sigma factor